MSSSKRVFSGVDSALALADLPVPAPKRLAPERDGYLLILEFLFGFFTCVYHCDADSGDHRVATLPRGYDGYVSSHPAFLLDLSAKSKDIREREYTESFLGYFRSFFTRMPEFWKLMRLVNRSFAAHYNSVLCRSCRVAMPCKYVLSSARWRSIERVPAPRYPLTVRCDVMPDANRKFFGGFFCAKCDDAEWQCVEKYRDELYALLHDCNCVSYV